jgi:hypothetical protein
MIKYMRNASRLQGYKLASLKEISASLIALIHKDYALASLHTCDYCAAMVFICAAIVFICADTS